MAVKAESNPVVNIVNKIRILTEGFHMMGLEAIGFVSTLLTGEAISYKNCPSPLNVLLVAPFELINRGYTTLPFMVFFPQMKRWFGSVNRFLSCKTSLLPIGCSPPYRPTMTRTKSNTWFTFINLKRFVTPFTQFNRLLVGVSLPIVTRHIFTRAVSFIERGYLCPATTSTKDGIHENCIL